MTDSLYSVSYTHLNNAGQGNHHALQTDPCIAANEVFAHAAGGFTRKGRQRYRRNGCIHPQAEHSAVDRETHGKGQHRNQQPADQRNRPQRDAKMCIRDREKRTMYNTDMFNDCGVL